MLIIIGAVLSRRVDVSISLAAGAVAYGVAAFGPGFLAATAAAFNTSMAYVLTSLAFAMALGFLLREQKTRIASGLSALGARAAAFAIPAAIGLLPCPAGLINNGKLLPLGLECGSTKFLWEVGTWKR